jgi:hypothetical protein
MPEFTDFKVRSCSSFDKKIGGSRGDESNCLETVFPYEEIRISPGNWRRSMLVSSFQQYCASAPDQHLFIIYL